MVASSGEPVEVCAGGDTPSPLVHWKAADALGLLGKEKTQPRTCSVGVTVVVKVMACRDSVLALAAGCITKPGSTTSLEAVLKAPRVAQKARKLVPIVSPEKTKVRLCPSAVGNCALATAPCAPMPLKTEEASEGELCA